MEFGKQELELKCSQKFQFGRKARVIRRRSE